MTNFLRWIDKILDCPDFGRLILRLTVGGLMLLHGWHKVLHGTSWIQGQLVANGFPAFLAYGVYIGEVVAPIFLILGILTRLSALSVAGTMVVAWLISSFHKTFTVDQVGAWGIEVIAFFFFSALVIAFLGAGRYSLAGSSAWK